MRLSRHDIQRYAEWSHDTNPLHVDAGFGRRSFFGRSIAHGMLTVTSAFAELAGRPAAPLRQLDLEFRGAVVPDADYQVEAGPEGDDPTLVLRAADSEVVLSARASLRPGLDVDTGWAAAASGPGAQALRNTPADRQADEFTGPLEIVGAYPTADQVPDGGWLTPLQVRVLGLCSYLVGMEAPGLRSLFTRLSIGFAPPGPDTSTLYYRLRRVRFDPAFRVLDTRVDIVTADDRPVAMAEIRSYVRFSPVVLDPPALAALLHAETRALAGKVALVTGGSRGLGAEITAGLAAAGCTVYATYRADRGAADILAETLGRHGLTATMVAADAGEASQIAGLLADIRARHGRLDLLVLNASAPPRVQPIAGAAAGADDFLSANYRLATIPLSAALPDLAAAGGTVVAVSSSFVEDPPAGFAPYVALKTSVEALVRSAVREAPAIAAVIVRPPRLQTAWNDTPTGVLGTIPSARAAAHLVNAAATAAPGTVGVIRDFPALAPPATAARATDVDADVAEVDADVARQDEDDAPPDLVVTVSSSFTAEPVLPGLRFWFRELGLRAEADLAPYGQVLQTLLTPPAPGGPRQALVILLRLRDWLRELSPAQLASVEAVREHLGTMVEDLTRAVQSHGAAARGETLLLLCPSDAGDADSHDPALAGAEADLQAALRGIPGLQTVAARDWHEVYGVTPGTIGDALREHIAHMPYTDAYYHVLATVAIRSLHRRLAPVRKVVVVDCDNTLWRGVVGEVGPEGLAFDPPHRALHQTLARLAASGVLLGLCSKNEEEDVWRVFETRPEFGLGRDQIVAAAINWRPKSENLRGLAQRLNLGLDSFIFLDDNPVECADVRSACPEVLTLQWPLDPDAAARLLAHTWELDAGGATAEDQRRTQLYKEEFKRQELRADTLTFRDFLQSLDLTVVAAPLAPDDVARASQLTNRTNQFNFTTRRRDEAELTALAADPRADVRTVRVTDRFGDYGLVGLVITTTDGEVTELDTFLLSCRVLGRGVEHHLAAELGRIALGRGASTVRLRVIPTKRNTPARAFLESITADQDRRLEDGATVCELAAATLADLRFEPTGEPEPVAEDGGNSTAAAAPDAAGGSDRLRTRERQVERTAYELATIDTLTEAIGGRAVARRPVPTAAAAGGIEAAVYEAFATALRMPVAQVRDVDRLDALGCDSFRIVEITVNLTQQFPWLPGTLLFEHRSVRDIASHIVGLSQPAAPAAASSSAAPRPPGVPAGDIAVVGLQLRCAGAASADELWTLLSGGGVAVTPVDPDRQYFLHRLDDVRPHFAGLVDGLDRFDAEFFGISPREAELMDPQLRLFLEVAWDALEDAGAAGDELDLDTGVFAGVMYSDYAHRANAVAQAQRHPYKSWEGFSLANRLSQILGLRGPSLAIDTACSSSGTALHLACRALQAGDCRVALVGGVNLILDPDRFAQLGRLGILSATGRCLSFGASADGTVLGEGAGVLVLRPLAEAVSRGDRVYGVIRGTGVSTGNGTVGFTAPNPTAQAQAISRALGAAHVDPRTVSYVETHGTATALGDPIEVRGLALARADATLRDPAIDGDALCAIGSIKPNVGHLEAGAGVISLIKVLLQLQHGTLLPSVTSEQPNPHIPFAELPYVIQRSLAPWTRPELSVGGRPTTLPRRAGVSSFGVGGANAHVILEEPPTAAGDSPVAGTARVLVTSARNDAALRARLQDLHAAVTAHPEIALADLCHSASVGRRHFPHRAAIVAADRSALIDALDRAAGDPIGAGSAVGDDAPGVAVGVIARGGPAPQVAFLFTGQGAQHDGMGRGLYDSYPAFREALDECAALLDPLLDRPLRAVLFAEAGSGDAALLDQTGYTQPALFAFEYAMARLWGSWGVVPNVVLGHSVGEIGAMCVAGGLALADACRLIAARGRLMQALPAGGVMVSLMTDEARVRALVAGREDRVAVAAINGPKQIVLSGEAAAVEEVAASLREQGVRTRALVVSHAFHSPLMRPMLDDYRAVVRSIRFAAPAIPFVSTVTGARADAEVATAEYWLRNVTDAVRFSDGIRAVRSEGAGVFVEVGPQPVLLGMGKPCVDDPDGATWIPSARRGAEARKTIDDAAARLFVGGAALDWRAATPGRRVTLPGYPFSRRRFWIETEPVGAPRRAAVAPAVTAEARRPDAYEVVWRPQPAGSVPVPRGGQRWAVAGTSAADILTLTSALEAAGAICPSLPSEHEPGGGASDRLHALERLRTLGQQPGGLDGVVVLVDTAGEGNVAEIATRAVTEVAAIAQALIGTDVEDLRLWIVTANAVRTGDRDDVTASIAAGSAVRGLGRTLALEHPERWGGLIDIGGREDLPAAAAEILRGGDDEIALRGDQRYAARLVPRRLDQAAPARLDPEGTYLVTGGLGWLGRRMAGWLIAHGAKRLVLSGRRGADTPGAAATVSALAASGARVEIVTADVATADGVDRLIDAVESSDAPLRGVVHAAGIDRPSPISTLTEADLHAVLAAKVTGAWRLHERTLAHDLDLFLSASSIAALLGSATRAHYGAANAFLDGLTTWRRTAGLPAVSVQWGPWSGGGIAGADALREFARIGNHPLDPDRALDLLDPAIASDSAVVAAMAIDWATFLPVYAARRPKPLVADLAGPSTPAAAAAPWVAELARVATAERHAALLTRLRDEAAQAMGFSDPGDLPVDQSLYDSGMDSLLAADFARRVQAGLGIRRSGLVFEHPRLDALTAVLLEAIGEPAPALAPTPAALTTPSGGTVSIERIVREELATTLAFGGPDDVPADLTFTEMGMDSLMAAEFAGRLRARLGIDRPGLVFDHPTVARLTGQLTSPGRAAVEPTPRGPAARPERDAVAPALAASGGGIATLPDPASAPGIGAFVEGEEEAVYAFQREAWPKRRDDWIAPRWQWMFVDSARRLGLDPQVWLYRDRGRVVGHNGAMPVVLKIGDHERTTAWLVDTMVLEAFRSQAVGSRLMVAAQDDLPFALSLGQTEPMRAIQIKLGWIDVGRLETAQFLVRPERVLRGKLPAPAAAAAGWGLRASQAVRDAWRGRAGGELIEVSRFDVRHDQLWTRAGAAIACAVRRDASYLNWKYAEQPGQQFLRFDYRRAGTLAATIVCAILEPEGPYTYRRGLIVDLVASLDDDEVLDGLLTATVAALAQRGADAVVCLHLAPRLTAALKRVGFHLREPGRHLLVLPGGEPAERRTLLADAGGWLVTQGDSDIDRPW